MSTGRKPSLCFVAPTIWPVLSGDKSIQIVGGAEIQQSMLARAFSADGYRVSIVTFDYGQPDGIEIDGVKVFRACKPDSGLPVLRFIHPRLTSLWRAMNRANADIYYQRACGMLTGVTAHFCRLHQRKMIFAAASDVDFNPALPLIKHGRDRALYRYGIRHCQAIVAQNADQLAACKQYFHRDATMVKSCYLAPPNPNGDPQGHILWVSTMRKLKQPEKFVELARRLPEHRFRMIGGAGAKSDEKDFFQTLRNKATELNNLEFTGFVPYSEIDQHFDQAKLFINTSEFEGFPNTFLQAWSRGIPTISFLRGRTTNTGHGPDWAVSNLDEMTEVITQLMNDSGKYKKLSDSCRTYFIQNHSHEAVVRQYQNVITDLRLQRGADDCNNCHAIEDSGNNEGEQA